MVSYQF